MPITNPQNGLTGYFLAPSVGAYRAALSGDWLSKELIAPAEGVEAVRWRSEADQYLQPWSVAERARLGIQVNPGQGEEVGLTEKGVEGEAADILAEVGI